jgi:hypothetical protein
MNIYSRVLRHINIKDVKQKHQQKLIEQKIEEEKKREEKEFVSFIMEKKKYSWRSELNEQLTTSDVFYTNLPAEGDVDLSSSDVNINFSGGTQGEVGSPSEGFYARTQIIGPVDSTRYDTLGITVTVNSTINSGEGLVLTSVSGISGASLILSPGSSSGTYYARLPSTSSSSSYRLIQIVSSTGSSTFTINKISYQRRIPKNVVLPLDSPEAVSFIRTGSGDLSPEEKQQKLKDMLKAGDEYVQQIHGDGFPGTGAVLPGEAGDTPGIEIAQVYPSDYERERKVDQMLLKGLQRGDYGTGPNIDKQIRQIQQNLQKGTPGGLPLA